MLTSKQRAFLRAMAGALETIIIVGKGGVTDNVTAGADSALTARELIKGRSLETCELSPRETADEIARRIDADVVQVIGTKFVLYRENPKLAKSERIILPK